MSNYFARVEAPDFRPILATASSNNKASQIRWEVSTSTTSLNSISSNANQDYSTAHNEHEHNSAIVFTRSNPVGDHEDHTTTKEQEPIHSLSPSIYNNEIESSESNLSNVNATSCHCRCSMYDDPNDMSINHVLLFNGITPSSRLAPNGISIKTENKNSADNHSTKSCLCCKLHNVTGLGTARESGKFFTQVLCAKIFQLAIVLGWLLHISFNSLFCAQIKRNFVLWMYPPSTVYLSIWLIIRCCPIKLPQPTCRFVAPYLIMTVCLAFAFGAATASLESNVFAFTVIVLLCSFSFLASISNLACAQASKVFVVSTLTVSLTTGVLVIVAKLYHSDFSKYLKSEVITLWVPVFFGANFISLIWVLETRCIITGRRFSLTQDDWLCAAVYL